MPGHKSHAEMEKVMKNVEIRPADIGDAEDILKVYAYYVTETAISFEYDVPTLDDFKGRMEKILENTYRNINIGLINELAILCDRMEISIWEVIDAAKTKPYGFQAFYPGPGLGGPLHSPGSLLPYVEGQGVRLPHLHD